MASSREDNISYLIDAENNKKCHADNEKLDLYNKTWKNVFRISPKENRNFNQQNEDRVENVIRNNKQRIEPYTTADLSRLEADNYLTRPITTKNITDIVTSHGRLRSSLNPHHPLLRLIIGQLFK